MNFKSIALAILFLASITLAQERYVKPVDEASQNASFSSFRTKLIAAAERHDSKYILSILDPKIELSFGGDSGIADFKRVWKINSTNSPFWREFLAVIKNGGTFNGDGAKRLDQFSAPYLFTSWPEDVDSFEYHAIFGNNVNLRREPHPEAEVVATLSYNVIKIESETVPKNGKPEYPGWLHITTLGGLKGYVKREFVRGPIDYRAIFERKRGVWKMVAFIAGD